MTTATRPAPNHNNLTCYVDYGCRLPDCSDRYRAYCRNRRHAQAAGTWQPFIDAEPVRQHLLALHAAGVTIHRVAALTGFTYNSVRDFTQHRYGNCQPRRQRVTPEVAARILALDIKTVTPSRIGSTGTRRRVEALVAIGWPGRHIATYADLSPTNLGHLIQRSTVKASTAHNIAEAYNQLRELRPEKNGVEKWNARKARKRAAASRWPTPKYWDAAGAIDDPEFVPEYKKLRAEIIAEESHWLMTIGGLDRDQAAARIGVARFTVDRALREHPQDEAEAVA